MTTNSPQALTFFPNSKELALSNIIKRTELAAKQIQDLQGQMEATKDETFSGFAGKSKLMQQILQTAVHDNISSLCGFLNEEVSALVTLQNDLTRLVLYYNSRMSNALTTKPKPEEILPTPSKIEQKKPVTTQPSSAPRPKQEIIPPSPKIAISKESVVIRPNASNTPSPAMSPSLNVDDLFGPENTANKEPVSPPVQMREINIKKDDDENSVRSPQDNDMNNKKKHEEDEKESNLSSHISVIGVLSDVATFGSEAGMDIAKMSDFGDDDFNAEETKSEPSMSKKPKKFVEDDDFINEIIPKMKPQKKTTGNSAEMFSFGDEGELIVKTNRILNLFEDSPKPSPKEEENQSTDSSKESNDSNKEQKMESNPTSKSPAPKSSFQNILDDM